MTFLAVAIGSLAGSLLSNFLTLWLVAKTIQKAEQKAKEEEMMMIEQSRKASRRWAEEMEKKREQYVRMES